MPKSHNTTPDSTSGVVFGRAVRGMSHTRPGLRSLRFWRPFRDSLLHIFAVTLGNSDRPINSLNSLIHG